MERKYLNKRKVKREKLKVKNEKLKCNKPRRGLLVIARGETPGF